MFVYVTVFHHRVLVGEVDNELDCRLKLGEIRAEPLSQIHH